MTIIEQYFHLTEHQRNQFEAIVPLYREWNERVNVISRKDIDELEIRHILHSLAIAKVCCFRAGVQICDIGSGGGLPAIPLAIMFPDAHFTAVDSIAKKCRVIQEIAHSAEIKNIKVINTRAENLSQQFDYVVSRAVAPMKQLLEWTWDKIRVSSNSLPNGIIVLKGGDLTKELYKAGGKYSIYHISEWFDNPFFETKSVIYRKKQG
jgi:16S rRNA (guanine527-N7)-methyltransferase